MTSISPPFTPARRPAFLHLWAGQLTTKPVWWSCWLRGRRQEPVSAEDRCTGNLPRPKDIPILGLLKAGYTVIPPTFIPIYLGLRTHHGYRLWNHWNNSDQIRWLPMTSISPPFTPSKEACIPSSVRSIRTNSARVMVLLASRAAARACQYWRLLPEKPTQPEEYPQAMINLWAAEGLLELLLSCLFTLGSELIMVTSVEPLK